MMRFARIVSYVVIGLLAAAPRGQAQPASSDTSRFYVEFTGGANLGHTSSGTLGAEGGYRISGPFIVFFEAGHIFNVGTNDLDARAKVIGDAVGATANASYKINYYDGGLRYNLDLMLMKGMLEPYALVGFGGTMVRAETTLSVNGTVVPPESLGVQFGDDLNGSVGKVFITFGGGVNYAIAKRYFADASLRYGRIFPKTDVIEGDTGINTFRIQFGVGVRF
jgi:opacity protein-like surface antigen